MPPEKALIVRLPDGRELPPMDEDALLQHAKNGEIPLDSKVRSTLLTVWTPVREMDLLKPVYAEQLRQAAAQHADNKWVRFKTAIWKRGDYDPTLATISQEGITYSAASFPLRLLAGLSDLLIACVIASASMLLFWGLFRANLLAPSTAAMLGIAVAWFAIATFMIFSLNFYGQTLGQRFWGIVVLTHDYRPVFPHRAMLFLLLTALLGVISPITIIFTGGRCTFQELLAGVRVRRIHIARRAF
jgi:uncharacterized RDD family membrane protein YckC